MCITFSKFRFLYFIHLELLFIKPTVDVFLDCSVSLILTSALFHDWTNCMKYSYTYRLIIVSLDPDIDTPNAYLATLIIIIN